MGDGLANIIKCTIVGDGGVGKTCMVISYTKNEFPTDHVPTIFDNYSAKIEVNGSSYNLNLFDTAGQEDYDRLRILSYPGTDIFLLCYAVTSIDSRLNAEEKWLPELQAHCPNAHVLLVGTQIDGRGGEGTTTDHNIGSVKNKKPLTEIAGRKLAKKLNCSGYVECSALTRAGLKGVFDEAIRTVLNPGHGKKPGVFSCWSR